MKNLKAKKTSCGTRKRTEIFFFYKKVKKQKAEPKKKSSKEIRAEEARQRLTELTQQAFELRKKFFDELRMTAQNEKIIDEAIMCLSAAKVASYAQSNFEYLKKCVEPFKENEGYSATVADVRGWYYHDKKNAKKQLLFALTNDNAKNGFYFAEYGEKMPTYKNNLALQYWYNVLAELGYTISTVEMELMTGKHEAFGKESEKDD